MKSNYKVNIIIMEGADCCGKTSQTRLLGKALENSIIIHHPTKKSVEKSDTLKLMNSVIYNNVWLDEVAEKLDRSEEDSQLYYDVEAELKRFENIIKNNIHQNYEDQMNTLKIINRIYRPDVDADDNEIYEFLENNCQCVYNGELLDNGSSKFKPKVKELIKKFRFTPQEAYVIFDRFFVSAECYNSFIVSERLKDVMDRLTQSSFFDRNDIQKYLDKYNREMNYIHSLTLHRSDDIIKQMNELVADICDDKVYLTSKYKNDTTKCKDLYPIAAFNMLDPRIHTFVFRPSKILYETTISCREVSDYDINSFIHERSNEFYKHLSDIIFKLISFDYILTEIYADGEVVLQTPGEILEELLKRCEEKFNHFYNDTALNEYLKNYVI